MPRRTSGDTKRSRIRVAGKSKIKKTEEQNEPKQEKFSFDEEIVIGLRRIDEPVNVEGKKKKSKKKKETNKTNRNTLRKNEIEKQKKNDSKVNKQKYNKKSKHEEVIVEEPEILIRSKYMENYEENSEDNYEKSYKENIKDNKVNSVAKNTSKKKKTKPQNEKSKRKKKKVLKVIKWLTLLGIVIAGIIYAMLSPIFNINNITVTGNSKISSETIISLSGLGIEQNIFNFRTSNVINSVKENAYIDKVEVKRKLPDRVEISVTERETTFMLTFGNAYAYINNQGYILEITNEKGNYPIITGYETATEQVIEGNRLVTNDLEKLNDVLKIMEATSSGDGELKSKITKIDIKDKTNYILTLEKEKKKIEFGDTTNLSTKILWINEFLDSEKENEGTIYLNVDLNNERPYFREKV